MAFSNEDRQLKFLVVDDFGTMRQIVKKSLREMGFASVMEAQDGEDAMSKLRANPDIKFIISDWNMPKMSGLEFLRAVRADENLKTLPFVMVTAEAEKENIIEAAKAGVSQYIIKPFTVDGLQQKLELVFSKMPRK